MRTNLIRNGDFGRGLSSWAHGTGVEPHDDAEGTYLRFDHPGARISQSTLYGRVDEAWPRLIIEARGSGVLDIEITHASGAVLATTAEVAGENWTVLAVPPRPAQLDTEDPVCRVSVTVSRLTGPLVDISSLVVIGEWLGMRARRAVKPWEPPSGPRPAIPDHELHPYSLSMDAVAPIVEMQQALATMLEQHVARLENSIRGVREALEGKRKSLPSVPVKSKAARARRLR